MSSRLATIVAHRQALVARSQAQRTELRAIAGELRGELALIDTLAGAVRAIRVNGPVIGAAAIAIVAIGPARIGRLVSKAAWLVPLLFSAYRGLRPDKGRTADA